MEEQRDVKEDLSSIVDGVAIEAARQAGAPLKCIGVLVCDQVGQLAWYNRAHPEFAAAIAGTGDTDKVATVGVTAEGNFYINVNVFLQHKWDAAQVRNHFDWNLLVVDPPQKTTLSIIRLSRAEVNKRVRSGLVKDTRVILECSRVPEHVPSFYLRMDEEGCKASWDEAGAAMMN